MAEFHIRYVIRRGADAAGLAHHRVSRNVEELGLAVDEPFDEPGTRDTIDLWALARDPLCHRAPS
jgi:hypothetical protein